MLGITACGSSPPPEAESRPTPEPESAQVDDPGDELACVRDDQCVASTLRCCECPLCPHAAVARTVAAERRLTEECRTDDCVTPRADECPPCPPDEARVAVSRRSVRARRVKGAPPHAAFRTTARRGDLDGWRSSA
ncbi:MAG: hypothetical protein M5U28_55440 [Sandaracinaceae bacterium]|nr:hypothetical protein [Sandaracinaceae bacterium]